MKKEELLEIVKKLKAKLNLAISEYDEAELVEATAIRIEYTEKIGQFECKQYELYLKLAEIKHKIEMVRAKINREEVVDMIAIDNEIAEIMASYYEKLNGMRGYVTEMFGYLGGKEVELEDMVEIKRIYRKLMKILHPDVLNSENDFDPKLWGKAQDAYKRNDLDTLKMIEDIVGDVENVSLESKDEADLHEMISRLEASIAKYEMKLEKLKNAFPFTEVEHLKNDAWVSAKQTEIEKNIVEYTNTIVIMTVALNDLLEEVG